MARSIGVNDDSGDQRPPFAVGCATREDLHRECCTWCAEEFARNRTRCRRTENGIVLEVIRSRILVGRRMIGGHAVGAEVDADTSVAGDPVARD